MPQRMKKGLFIAGTDTGVGKTILSGAVTRYLVEKGLDCGVMKPIESGCLSSAGQLIPKDGSYLRDAARSSDPIESITPYRFEPPLSPYALTIQGNAEMVDLQNIVEVYRGLAEKHRFMIVEGMGGLMVPLTSKYVLIDLIRLLELPVLLIAKNGLGTLNHTLLSLRYAEAQGIHFSGIILNRSSPNRDPSEESNGQILSERSTVPVVGPFPYIHSGTQSDFNREKETLIQKSGQLIRKSPSILGLIKALVS